MWCIERGRGRRRGHAGRLARCWHTAGLGTALAPQTTRRRLVLSGITLSPLGAGPGRLGYCDRGRLPRHHAGTHGTALASRLTRPGRRTPPIT